MSDDVKAAIAEAWTGTRYLSSPYQAAERIFDAAVEAGMAPAAEVERLREALEPFAALETHGWVHRHNDPRLERVCRDCRTLWPCPMGQAIVTARAALDGDDDDRVSVYDYHAVGCEFNRDGNKRWVCVEGCPSGAALDGDR